MMGLIKKVLLLIVLMMISVMGLWRQYSAFSGNDLKGVYASRSKPVFTWTSFISGDFQDDFYDYTEDLPGLKGSFVRIRNQFDYSLFGIPRAEKIIRGGKGYLFGEENILAWMGKDFAGSHYLDVKLQEMKQLQDELWNRKKIFLLLVITPDKASYYPELIPHRFAEKKEPLNNYLYYGEKVHKAGINVIDFNSFFLKAKDTSRYPLFAKTGMHWSYYGSLLAADSLIRYLNSKLDIRLPEIIMERIDKSGTPRDDDEDISRTMNLFFRIRQPELAYPVFHFNSDSTTLKPSALFIGDSFYWNWYRPGIIRNLFRNQDFWYYDKEVYPASFVQKRYTWQLDLKREIERHKVIVLLHNNNGEGCDFGYGFTDRAWPEYDRSGNNRIRNIEAYLTKSEENMRFYEKKAKEWNAPLETVIRTDAIFTGNKLLRKKK